MFNPTNTPSYFIRKTKNSSSFPKNIQLKKSMGIPQESDANVAESFQESLSLPSRSSSGIAVTEDKVESINDNIKEESDDNRSDTSISGYRSVSVATRWTWDDIFHTVSTTNDAGTHVQ